ncbi:MAG: glutamine amidotransferase [Pseudomonadota bacterium]|nr:glutamine amidotransferase [Pseudomonadota bacterium]
MKPLVILKTGNTHASIRARHRDFEHWFLNQLPSPNTVRVVNVAAGESPGNPWDWSGIIVTGSPAMVTEQLEWSQNTARWLEHAVARQIPVLGVCYGHQLLAHALGGKVGDRYQGRESGTLEVTLNERGTDDLLLGSLPRQFQAHLTHQQSVLQLPEGAVLLASSTAEPNQAFRVGPRAWGVQFHPEFTADIMREYLTIQEDSLRQQGQDAEQLIAEVTDAPEATSLISTFARLAARQD